jgi:hypothetical protein
MSGLGLGVGLGAVGVAALGVSKAIGFVGDSIGAAVEESKGIATLTQAIEANDDAWNGNIDAVEDVIRARTDLAFADDEQRDSLQRLVSVTGDVNKALDLQRTAMDLARLRGMDLATAGDLIGKVYAGNLGILSRYGIVLEKGTTATEALAEIQRRAEGQAEAYAETTGGQLEAAQLGLNDAMEDFGAVLLPIVTSTLPLLTDALGLLNGAIEFISGGTGGSGSLDGLIADLKETEEAAVAAAIATEGAWAGTGSPFDSAIDGVFALQDALEDLGFAPHIAQVHDWMDALRPMTEVLGENEASLYQFVEASITAGKTFEETEAAVVSLWQSADDEVARHRRIINPAIDAIVRAYDPLSSIEVDAFDIAGPIRESFRVANEAIAKGMGGIKDALKNPPQLISTGQREENMEARLREIMRNIREAQQTHDDASVRYWEKIRAKQSMQLDNLRGKTGISMKEIKTAYDEAGISVEGTWADANFVMTEATRRAGEAAVAHMRSAKDDITHLDWVQTGTDMMKRLGIGMEEQAPFVYAAADRIAADIAYRLRNPEPEPAKVPAAAAAVTATASDGRGVTVNIHGNVYGGDAGLRDLDRHVRRAVRLAQRNRD